METMYGVAARLRADRPVDDVVETSADDVVFITGAWGVSESAGFERVFARV